MIADPNPTPREVVCLSLPGRSTMSAFIRSSSGNPTFSFYPQKVEGFVVG
jgi:hypothetical protein